MGLDTWATISGGVFGGIFSALSPAKRLPGADRLALQGQARTTRSAIFLRERFLPHTTIIAVPYKHLNVSPCHRMPSLS